MNLPKTVSLILAASLSLGVLQAMPAEEPLPLPTEWSTLYLVQLERPAEPRPKDAARDAALQAHIQYQLRMHKDGKAIAAGGAGANDAGIIGFTLLRAPSLAEAERLASEDPGVKAGLFKVRVLSWQVPAGQLK
jgi:uncharacterized protein YciI